MTKRLGEVATTAVAPNGAGDVLSTTRHDRDVAGLRYVYPVVSRRAGGVSVGINLNPNNACNWACVYCQVPDLVRGGPPPLDLALLREEFSGLLQAIIHGDYLVQHAPEGFRQLVDVAFSGNGEPTSAREFADAVALVLSVMASQGLLGRIPPRLITNGSLIHRPEVQHGLVLLAQAGGEVWFKLDGGQAARTALVNQVRISPERQLAQLRRCASLCPTWVQTCWFALDGEPPSRGDEDAYLALLGKAAPSLRGVHLYGVARAPQGPFAQRVSPLPPEALQAFARRIMENGLQVRVNP